MVGWCVKTNSELNGDFSVYIIQTPRISILYINALSNWVAPETYQDTAT
jgi:hypothetical protein